MSQHIYTRTELENNTRDGLRVIARSLSVPRQSSMNKAALVTAILGMNPAEPVITVETSDLADDLDNEIADEKLASQLACVSSPEDVTNELVCTLAGMSIHEVATYIDLINRFNGRKNITRKMRRMLRAKGHNNLAGCDVRRIDEYEQRRQQAAA